MTRRRKSISDGFDSSIEKSSFKPKILLFVAFFAGPTIRRKCMSVNGFDLALILNLRQRIVIANAYP